MKVEIVLFATHKTANKRGVFLFFCFLFFFCSAGSLLLRRCQEPLSSWSAQVSLCVHFSCVAQASAVVTHGLSSCGSGL